MFEQEIRDWLSSLARLARQLSDRSDETTAGLFVVRLYDVIHDLLHIVEAQPVRDLLRREELLWLQDARDRQCHARPNYYPPGKKYTKATVFGRLYVDAVLAEIAAFRATHGSDEAIARSLALRLADVLGALADSYSSAISLLPGRERTRSRLLNGV